MSEEKKRPEKPEKKKRHAISIGKIFYHNTFVLAFSFVVAVVILVSGVRQQRRAGTSPSTMCPLSPAVSAAAQEEGLQIFSMSYTTVDLEVSGNNLLTSQLTASDFEVSVTLNPTSTKRGGQYPAEDDLAGRGR